MGPLAFLDQSFVADCYNQFVNDDGFLSTTKLARITIESSFQLGRH